MNIRLLVPQNKQDAKAVALTAGRAIEKAADKVTGGWLDKIANAVVASLEAKVAQLEQEERSHGQ